MLFRSVATRMFGKAVDDQKIARPVALSPNSQTGSVGAIRKKEVHPLISVGEVVVDGIEQAFGLTLLGLRLRPDLGNDIGILSQHPV